MWDTDTMYRQVKYLDGNQYAKVFSNGTYFAEIYPTEKKAEAGQALKMFVTKLGVPEELKVNGSKEKNSPGTGFIKCCQRYFIPLTTLNKLSPWTVFLFLSIYLQFLRDTKFCHKHLKCLSRVSLLFRWIYFSKVYPI